MVKIPRCAKINIPLIGFGTWLIPAKNAEKLVSTALKVGYNHIDCAEICNNEAEIGKCFEKIKNRSDLYITSKLWSSNHEPHLVSKALDKTLNNLKIDYLDLYLLHNPLRMNNKNLPLGIKKEWVLETWKEMIKLKNIGKVKRIGVSNFTTTKLQWLIDEGEKPCNNQVEMHPYLQQNKLVNFCNANDITLTAYSPLGNPSLSKYLPSILYPNSPTLMNDSVINDIAFRHGVTAAQVLLKWEMNRGIPVLVKSSSETRMKENLDSINLELTSEDMEAINKIDKKCRYLTFKCFLPKDHSPEQFFDGEFFN